MKRLFELKKKKHILLFSVPIIIVLAAIYFYTTGGRYVSTDNAYLKAHRILLVAEVSGKVIHVNIQDNQFVEKGQVLLTIDPQPYEIAVRQAKENLSKVQNNIESIRAEYYLKLSELTKTQEDVRYWTQEEKRYQTLKKTKAVSVAKADKVKHQWRLSLEEEASKKYELSIILARLNGCPTIAVEDHPDYKQAVASLDKANLDLERTTVVSPLDGITSNVKMETGEYVLSGRPLFSIMDNKNIWIEANLKETDLTYVTPGQTAMIEIDAYPGRKFKADVTSITPATGSEFSILPPQNASGNWVKVVQRIMVHLKFKSQKDRPNLIAGMSSYVTIDTVHNRIGRWFGS
mgnify:CR=1 FL=1|tara:strand:+ start:1567 stop:2607 length:1041 start_codon:yes stop_codon:yes gene_type:complete